METSYCVVNTDERNKDLISFKLSPRDTESGNKNCDWGLSDSYPEVEATLLVQTESATSSETKLIEDNSSDESEPCTPPSTRLIREEICAFENLKARSNYFENGSHCNLGNNVIYQQD